MDSLGFSLFAAGFSYQGSWKKVSRTFNSTVDLSNNSDVPASTDYKVVFNIKWIKEFRGLDVELNPLFTKFEGYTLSQLSKQGVKSISTCLEEALDQHLSHSPKTPIDGGGSTPIFGGGSGGAHPLSGSRSRARNAYNLITIYLRKYACLGSGSPKRGGRTARAQNNVSIRGPCLAPGKEWGTPAELKIIREINV